MGKISYEVGFPGPVGKHETGGLAATVILVDDSRSKAVVEEAVDEAVARYLRGVEVTSARSLTCSTALLDDLSSGAGNIFAGPSAPRAVRIGSFQVERMASRDAGIPVP